MSDPNLVQIESGNSRRDLLRTIAGAAMIGALSPAMAQHVHQAAATEKSSVSGPYRPKAFTAHEYATIQRLTDLIVPVENNQPGALAAGAPEFIDILSAKNNELQAIYVNGVKWLDRAMMERQKSDFVSAPAAQQTALMDVIAYSKNETLELQPGIRFFDWARKMTIDAYFTSKVGIQDIGFMGNTAVSEFHVPPEVMEYLNKRSPV